jgi:hypothetical protein
MKILFIVWFVVSIVANVWACIHFTKKAKEEIKKLNNLK